MQNKIIYISGNQENYRKELEDICIQVIDEEAGLFFKSCSKAAYAFSMLTAKDCKSWSREAFEAMVVSPVELYGLIQRINGRICREINLEENDAWDDSEIRFDTFVSNHNVIDRRIHDYQLSDRITAVSEYVTGNAFSLILGSAFSSNIIDYIFSKVKIGEKILGENNRQNRAEQFQKEIYNHIEGSLINLKTKLKNELTTKWIQYISGEETDIPKVV